MNEKRKANGDKCLWTGKNEQQHEQQVQVSNGNNNNNRLSVSQADSDRARERESERGRANALWQREEVKGERERASPTSQADRAKPSKQRLLISVCVQSTFWPKRVSLASAHEPSVGLPSSRITPPFSLAHSSSLPHSPCCQCVCVCV